jgi:O-antigen/teichoic acid export membrane protein
MGVSLYTSRVVLAILGVDDFGIYQAVAGVVGMFTFLNSALATGTSRFITYAIGEEREEKLNRVFSVSLLLHVFISIVFIILAETVGLYFLYNKLVLPMDRMDSIFWVFQLTVLGSVITIIQVPYTADIISHEQMGIYAYLSIFEVVLKLLIVFLLTKGPIDKLLLYSLLLLTTQVLVFLVYYYYCKKNYKETHQVTIKLKEDKRLFKEIGSFSGWSLLSVSSSMLANQGVVVLLNMFFSPAVVSARAISNQVNNVVNQFVQNFRTAINPQIVKTYAQNDQSHSSFLVLISTKVSFYLVLLIGMPLLLNAEFLLNIWLVEVPEYTTIFLQLIILQSFIQTIDNSLYYGLYACGKIKQNAIISPSIALLGFPICYILFKLGCSPVSLSWCYIGVYSLIGLIIKPILLNKYANYSVR